MSKVYLLDGRFYGITDRMSGKMKGMYSLNTSPSCNPFCQAMRSVPGSICEHCYSKGSEARWKNSKGAWTNNYYVLSEHVLKDSEIPQLNHQIFRFQAHGDLANRTHYRNLVAIAEANPKVMFALWTKNLRVINQGGVVVRDNLTHVYSTPRLNVEAPVLPKKFDKVFSVYNRKNAEAMGISINCQTECISCRLCYAKNDVAIVNEHIKAERGRGA
jgi:hypothetical protein